MTELEKNPVNHKFNFFKKKEDLKEATFVADRASNLMLLMFFQPLFLTAFLVIFGFTNAQGIIEYFQQNQTTLFNFGLYSMALVSMSDFVTTFYQGFKSRKATHDWGMKSLNKAFSLSMTNFMTYYMMTAVMYPLLKDIFKTF